MAKSLLMIFFFTINFFLMTTPSNKVHDHPYYTFSRNLSLKDALGLNKRQKLSHLHFYFHDVVTAQNPTAVKVAGGKMSNASATLFGTVMIIDDALTLGPIPTSKQVGRAQGMYAFASQSGVALLTSINFVFTEGKFNSSTLSISGRNQVSSAVREMPVVGGSGVFRFARGYAQARTYTFDAKTGNAVVEYNVHVFHY